ncbi:MAG: NAD(P)/FAD-dependent oxidoreductase [Thermodesulfobacteriota bacterium]|nr:NAD(P)/FAD-dependent oxidoreductase [Thermodesulfobacteriota bacterium]
MSEYIDVIIVGAGPAGLQAAVHAARKKANVLILGKPEQSNIYRAHVENYLCVDGVTDGGEMVTIGLEQATRFGAEFVEEDVLGIEQEGNFYIVRSENRKYIARSVILATGTSKKKLKVKGEKEFTGRGVSYCVDCDANFFRNAKVAVVGNGSGAVDGALTLLNYASEVYLVAKELNVSRGLRERLSVSEVKLKEGVWPSAIAGKNNVEFFILDDGSSLEVEGVFVELGAKGAIELATTLGVTLDMETFSHIEVNRKMETNLPGVYAAGDITGQPHQMAKAVGEGCVAGWNAANYVNKLKRKE